MKQPPILVIVAVAEDELIVIDTDEVVTVGIRVEEEEIVTGPEEVVATGALQIEIGVLVQISAQLRKELRFFTSVALNPNLAAIESHVSPGADQYVRQPGGDGVAEDENVMAPDGVLQGVGVSQQIAIGVLTQMSSQFRKPLYF